MRKQNIFIEEKEKAQLILKLKILKLIATTGLAATEYQIDHLVANCKMRLPTILNHRETVRIYQLTVADYKRELEKQINKH